MQIHQLKRNTPQKKGRYIGRGGKRGTTSGKGTKGQKARAGRKMRPEIRDIIKKLPKLRGYRFSPISDKPVAVNLEAIDKAFVGGEEITPATLIEKKVIGKAKGKIPAVKILGTGLLTKSLKVSGCAVSASARAKIEKAGGSVA